MINYGFFYDIATYANENWRGKLSPKEVACNAYDYLCEYNVSIEQDKPTYTMQELYNLLEDDCKNGSEEAKEFLEKITDLVPIKKTT